MLAASEGKQVQFRYSDKCEWEDVNGDPGWNWHIRTYRIKPEPREWWPGVDKDGRSTVFFVKPTCELKFGKRRWIGNVMIIGVLVGSLVIGIIIRNYERPPLWAFSLVPFAVWGVLLRYAEDEQ